MLDPGLLAVLIDALDILTCTEAAPRLGGIASCLPSPTVGACLPHAPTVREIIRRGEAFGGRWLIHGRHELGCK